MSSAKGNLGEHLIMAELIHNGFHAFMADRDNPAFDIMILWPETGRKCAIRVKTTSNHSAIWTVKKSGAIFLDQQLSDDFVAIVDIGSGLRERDVYLVETESLLTDIQDAHSLYVSHPKKDGSPRKQEQGMRCIRFFGDDKPDNISYAFDRKYSKFKDAWGLLK